VANQATAPASDERYSLTALKPKETTMTFASQNLTAGQLNAIVKKLGGEQGALRFLADETIVSENPKNGASRTVIAKLLEEVGQPVDLPAIERFVAREKFVVDRNGELPISHLGDNFRANFLDVVEENVEAAKLTQRKLLKRSVDKPILSALDGEEKARIALAHVFDYLKTADRNLWFIFYVKDAKGVLWAVYAGWDDGGWYVDADAVSNPDEWRDGRRVVSR
jgi:hypothetical protein